MRKSVILLLLLFYALIGFSQSKKDQIEMLNLRVDSLNSVIFEKSNDILNYQTQLKQLQTEIKDLEAKYISLEFKTTNKTTELNQFIRRLNDSLSVTRKEILKLTSTRDFSNGQFTEQETQFIIDYFTNQLKIRESSEVVVNKVNDELVIQIKGELGYVHSYSLSTSYNPELAGDLDEDGSFEILFQVERSFGGTYAWLDLYCLKVIPDASYALFELGIECPCGINNDCGESYFPEIVDISANEIIIQSRCYNYEDIGLTSEQDAMYTFINNQLFLKK